MPQTAAHPASRRSPRLFDRLDLHQRVQVPSLQPHRQGGRKDQDPAHSQGYASTGQAAHGAIPKVEIALERTRGRQLAVAPRTRFPPGLWGALKKPHTVFNAPTGMLVLTWAVFPLNGPTLCWPMPRQTAFAIV